MKLCLSCFHVWPAHAAYCGYCHRTFGGRLCPKKHLSPVTAQYCIQCGSNNLTDPTSHLSLGWIVRLFAIVIVLGTAIVLWIFLRKPLAQLGACLFEMVISIGFLLFVVRLVAGEGVWYRIWSFLHGGFRTFVCVVRISFALLRRLSRL